MDYSRGKLRQKDKENATGAYENVLKTIPQIVV